MQLADVSAASAEIEAAKTMDSAVSKFINIINKNEQTNEKTSYGFMKLIELEVCALW